LGVVLLSAWLDRRSPAGVPDQSPLLSST